jgi:hypothetical protein
MMHNTLNIKTAVAYIPYQDLENKEMMSGILTDPADFAGHIRRFSNSLTTQMVFGFRTISREDPRLLQFFKVHGSVPNPSASTDTPHRVLRPGVRSLEVPVLSYWISTLSFKDFQSS